MNKTSLLHEDIPPIYCKFQSNRLNKPIVCYEELDIYMLDFKDENV